MLKKSLLVNYFLLVIIVHLGFTPEQVMASDGILKKRIIYKGNQYSYFYFEPTTIHKKEKGSNIIVALHNDNQDGFDFLQKSNLYQISKESNHTLILLNSINGYDNIDTAEVLRRILDYYSIKVNDITSTTIIGFGAGGDFTLNNYCLQGEYDRYISIYGIIEAQKAKTCKASSKNLLTISAGKDLRNKIKKINGANISKLLSQSKTCDRVHYFSENDIVGGEIEYSIYQCNTGSKISGIHVEKGLGKWGKSELYDNKFHNSEISSIDYTRKILSFIRDEDDI